MNLKLISIFFGVSTLLFVQGSQLMAQIPANELPSPGTDTGLEGKYDPQNGIAQLIRGEKDRTEAKIFEDAALRQMPRCPQALRAIG